MQPLYIMMSGLPGSGKTTTVTKLLELWGGSPIVMVSTDAYIEGVAWRKGKTYSEVFSDTIDEATDFMNKLRNDALIAGDSIIHDQTNLTPKRRQGKLSDVPDRYRKVCIVSEVPELVRQQRLKALPGKVIPPKVDEDMLASWKQPRLTEGFSMVCAPEAIPLTLAPWLASA